MILGAGVFQVPAIVKAKEMGLFTIVVSHNPSEPGHNLANVSINCSTIDKEQVLRLAKQHGIDGIMTIASEIASLTVSFVAEKMGLPGYTLYQAETIGKKHLLRQFLHDHGFITPGFVICYSLKEAMEGYKNLKKPVFVKPSTSSGSAGVSKINSEIGFAELYHYTMDANIIDPVILVEENIEGIEVGGEAFIINGEVQFAIPSKKYINEAHVPYGHMFPSDLPGQIKSELKDYIGQIVKMLKLKNGPLNFDMMITSRGPVVIELGARLGGNCLPELLKLHTGFDSIKAVIQIALNESVPMHEMEYKPMAAYIFHSRADGIVRKMKSPDKTMFSRNIDILKFHSSAKKGSKVEKFTSGKKQLGHILFTAKDKDDLVELMKEMHQIDWIEIED